MKLSELFPQGPKVIIQGKEYELKFSTRAVLQFEMDYPDTVIDDKKVTTQQQTAKVLGSVLSGIKAADLIDVLYASLLHTKAFKDKDSLIDAMDPKDFGSYADAVFNAYFLSNATPEQLEKLEVMSQTNGAKKNEDSAIMPKSGPSIVSNAG